jgi:uncharacterized membrane protein YfcA
MKTKVYLLIFAGIIAISLAVFSLLTVNPNNESWSSLALGAVVGCMLGIWLALLKKEKTSRQSLINITPGTAINLYGLPADIGRLL